MLKRLFLFLLTNLLIVTTISILITVLGLHPYFSANGINYTTLAAFCFIWGSGGAFISLFMSKWVAKTAMGVEAIESDQNLPNARALIQLVSTLSKKAGLTISPEVGIYHSSELNAFATGSSRTNSLLAVSTGLLENLNHAEVEGVIGHEISHIANGDMVTMTLILGVVNSFSLFLSQLIAYTIATATSRGDHEDGFSSGVYFILTLVFDILFTLLGSMLVAAFSRYREYRADAGGAKLAGKNKMIEALKRLQLASENEDNRAPTLATLKISRQPSWLYLFSTHPPIAKRIARLSQLVTV